MSRTKRTGSSKTAQRVVPLLVGAAVATVSAVLLSGGPASAAAHTVTVSFTADGPSPASVTIQPGDEVVYRNDIDPSSGSLLGVVTGSVRSVTVDVRNAAQTPFELEPGKRLALTYGQPVKATYTATYQPAMLLGLLPGKTMDATGTLLVRDTSGGTVPVAAPPSPVPTGGGAKSPLAQSDQQQPAQQPAQQQSGSARSDGSAAQGGPKVNYTPNSGDVAAGQVPRGGSAGQVPAGTSATPSAAAGTGPDQVSELPQLGSAQSHPRQLGRASSDHPIGSLGLPAIAAVVLLSMVSAGLVRTIMVRSASLA